MASFSVADAAFSGLKVFRARPAVFLAWYLLTILTVIVSLGAMAMLIGPALAQLQTATANRSPVVHASPVLFGFLYLIPVWLLASAVSVGAANRAILKPKDAGFGYIRFGADELRLAVTLLGVGVVLFLVYVVSLVGLVIVAAVVIGGLFKSAPASTSAAVGISIGFLLSLIPVAALVLYVAARFSLSTALTIHTRSIRIFDSWRLTKGHSGKIVLSLLLAAVVYFGMYLAGVLTTSMIVLMMGGKVSRMFQPDLTSLHSLLTPSMVVYVLIMGLTSTAAMALLYCPGAYIYSQITGGSQADVF
jgi:hypothetical protein